MRAERFSGLHPLCKNLLLFVHRHAVILSLEVLCMINWMPRGAKMPNYDIAHVNEQGIDLIIVPLESRFGLLSESEQVSEMFALQQHAQDASLRGTVIPVWESGGRMAVRAPDRWHPFFESINLAWVAANINRNLY
ncbi:MAG: hypothetical protein ABSF22_14255 [Bryobacteraceae bacterium]|jgi:hypothetical protein